MFINKISDNSICIIYFLIYNYTTFLYFVFISINVLVILIESYCKYAFFNLKIQTNSISIVLKYFYEINVELNQINLVDNYLFNWMFEQFLLKRNVW